MLPALITPDALADALDHPSEPLDRCRSLRGYRCRADPGHCGDVRLAV